MGALWSKHAPSLQWRNHVWKLAHAQSNRKRSIELNDSYIQEFDSKRQEYIFDYGAHIYIRPCIDLFKSSFEHRANKIEYIEGDSVITVPKFIEDNQNLIGTFDFIHIDGGHDEEFIKNDFKYCDILIKKPGGIIIIDDTNMEHINNEVDFYIKNNNYVELFFLDLSNFAFPHRIIQKKMINFLN